MTKKYTRSMEQESQHMLKRVEEEQKSLKDYYLNMLKEPPSKAEIQQKEQTLKQVENDLFKAWSLIVSYRDELYARWKDVLRQEKKRRWFKTPPANALIDIKEEKKNHFFAKGMNLYKLLLIGCVGSFAGVLVEMAWCLITRGTIESRAGVVYGPFNPLYGAGAILMTVCFYKYRNRGRWILFLGGMLAGSALEYFCSWGEELVMGSRSWDYSQMPFNLNGRICLVYSIFWGILTVIWIKDLYPRLAKWILKIPNRLGKVLTWAWTIFLVFDLVISGIAMFRWSQRTQGQMPSNGFWEVVDEHFPDERMENVYTNMQFTKE